jgi:hypothetical protein
MNQNKSFRFLWAGQSLALFGDGFYTIALVTLVFHLTGTATFTALVPIFRVSAMLISGIVAPLMINRYPLYRILLFSQFGLVVLSFLLTLFCRFLLPYNSTLIIFPFIVLISFLEGWITPARNSLVPRLVPEDQLVKANGYMATTDQTLQLVSWAIGGTLVVIMGPDNVLWLASFLFLLSLLSLYRVQDRTQAAQTKTSDTSKWDSIREGWVYIWQIPSLRTITVMEVVEGIANGTWAGAILLVYVK